MTISTTGNRISYAGNGVTVAFNCPFKFFEDSDIVVIEVTDATGAPETLTLVSDYSVSGAGDPSGGTVTCVVAPATGVTLVIYRGVPYTQETDYILGDNFPAETHERALDKITVLAQQNADLISRSLQVSDSYPGGASVVVPDPESLAYLRWNLAGTALENTKSVSSIAAEDVPIAGISGISATDVQGALSEIQTEKINVDDIGTTVLGTTLVTQPVAEAGTDTSAAAWSAQRVSQAIASLGEKFSMAMRADSTTETLGVSDLDQMTVASVSSAITKTLPSLADVDSGTMVGFTCESANAVMTIAPNAFDSFAWGVTTGSAMKMGEVSDTVVLIADPINNHWRVVHDGINGPYFEATYTGSAQTLTASTITKLQYNVDSSDPYNAYDHVTNYRFTPGVPGWYLITMGAFLGLSAASRIATYLYRDGAIYLAGNRLAVNIGGGNDVYARNTWIAYATNTSFFECFAEPLGGVSGTFDDPTNLEAQFSARRLK